MIKNTILSLIRFYQHFNKHLPRVCRFYPTCSQYTFEAISRYGIGKGTLIGIKRLFKCNPFHSGGYDPLR